MEIGISNSYNVISSYSIKLNDKELLVFEEKSLDGSRKSDAKDEDPNSKRKNAIEELSEDEKRLVKDLQSRDSEVRTHETAHQAAGGGMTGAASFTYQQGPDGQMYAIGGEVPISIPSGSTPQETIQNAQQAIAAAMAPANPSGQDFAVASSAAVMLMKAQQQLTKEAQEKMLGMEIYKNKTVNTLGNSSSVIDMPA